MLGSRCGNGNGNFAHLSKPHTQSIHHTRVSAETDYPYPNPAAPDIMVVFGMILAVIPHVPTHSKTNLLEAATAWMTRSKVSTVLAIAPLSTVAVSTSAEATVILGAVDAGAPDTAFSSGFTSLTKGPVFNSPAANGGVSFGSTVNASFERDSPVAQFTVTYAGSNSIGTLPASLVEVGYQFTVGGQPKAVTAERIEMILFGPGSASLGTQTLISFASSAFFGSGTNGLIQGTASYNLASASPITGYSVSIIGSYDSDGNGTIDIIMNQANGDGFILTPVPEPSTSALVALGVLGCVIRRRRESRTAGIA